MRRGFAAGLLCVFASLSLAGSASAQQGNRKCYIDYRKNEACFPLGDISFADEVIAFEEGDPATSDARARNIRSVLGPPDYDEKRRRII